MKTDGDSALRHFIRYVRAGQNAAVWQRFLFFGMSLGRDWGVFLQRTLLAQLGHEIAEGINQKSLVSNGLGITSGFCSRHRLGKQLSSITAEVISLLSHSTGCGVDGLWSTGHVVEQASKFTHQFTPDVRCQSQAFEDRCQ